ncbi:aspartate aminotransferase family protein [Rhizobium sullae]|uniref:4-aminobutyrate--pyruvate transaminase n=1 Tax=Rhizobium sullae TaxID=50338 RepID=A0A4V2V8C1_RHISU|nr:aspartate aminotransferase family protein [Rhizobium sullae]TCU12645.1 4-aminobutyrate--pyruvate transaminase [Rhizobium sullae]
MTAAPNSAEARDIAYHLHGYTNAKKHSEIGPLVIERGENIYVIDSAGNRYIEAMAGLWCTALGFSEKRLVQAAARQMAKLPFYHTFTHKSHGPVVDLAEKLVSMAPVPMSKAFFTNSGSEAIDTALKLIWYRANALGEPQRKKIVVRNRAYHGVTVAGSCLTSLPGNHRSFDLIVSGVSRLTCPHYWREAEAGETEESFSTRLAEELEETILSEGPETIAAFFGEPVIGAGGVVVPPRTYWDKIQALLQKYDILFVADEVICGFGRTGSMFGTQTYDLKPDMMVLSKQLSSSYLPASALLINDRVFDPIADESNRIGTLGHGYTGGGHPVAAAVALETIRIIEEENLVAHAAAMGERLRTGLHRLGTHPLVGEVRGVGLMAAVELVTDKSLKTGLELPGQLGAIANNSFQEAGVISRIMGDALAFCPPLIISENQVDDLLGRFRQALDATLASLPAGSGKD